MGIKITQQLKQNLSNQGLVILSLTTLIGLGGMTIQSADAASISGLYTTGVDSLGNLLAPGVADSHYIMLETGTNPVVMTSHPWLSNGPNSMWLWENSNGQPTFVTRTFRTTFDLTGLDPSTASITGQWIVDDFGVDILINGISTGQTSGGQSLFNFNITSGFVAEINTLDFVVQDGGALAGFRVTEIAGTAAVFESIPESSSLVGLFAVGTVLGLSHPYSAVRRRSLRMTVGQFLNRKITRQ